MVRSVSRRPVDDAPRAAGGRSWPAPNETAPFSDLPLARSMAEEQAGTSARAVPVRRHRARGYHSRSSSPPGQHVSQTAPTTEALSPTPADLGAPAVPPPLARPRSLMD